MNAFRHRFVEIAGEGSIWRGNVKAALAKAAQTLGIKPRRAKALYYLEARVIAVNEYYTLKARIARIVRLQEQTKAHNDALRRMAAGLDRVGHAPAGRHGIPDQAEVPPGNDAATGRSAATAEEI